MPPRPPPSTAQATHCLECKKPSSRPPLPAPRGTPRQSRRATARCKRPARPSRAGAREFSDPFSRLFGSARYPAKWRGDLTRVDQSSWSCLRADKRDDLFWQKDYWWPPALRPLCARRSAPPATAERARRRPQFWSATRTTGDQTATAATRPPQRAGTTKLKNDFS